MDTVHGVDAEGNVVIRRKLKRRYIVAFFQKLPPCLVGIEACASWRVHFPAKAIFAPSFLALRIGAQQRRC
jgi:transposase